jgi:hypothetical protein
MAESSSAMGIGELNRTGVYNQVLHDCGAGLVGTGVILKSAGGI